MPSLLSFGMLHTVAMLPSTGSLMYLRTLCVKSHDELGVEIRIFIIFFLKKTLKWHRISKQETRKIELR